MRTRATARLAQLGVLPEHLLDLSYRARDRAAPNGDDEFGSLLGIGAYYRSLPSGRMTVLGGPGTGKTVLAVQLTLDLLGDRDSVMDAVQPVPVMLKASGWDPEMAFGRWLATQLHISYGLKPRVSRALVEGGCVLPLLDGLDEMDRAGGAARNADAALSQLNEPPWGNRHVVAVSRSASAAGLNSAGVIELCPVTAEEARAYLIRRREAAGLDSSAWTAVINALETHPSGPVARTLAVPWALNLMPHHLSTGGDSAARKIASARNPRKLENLLFADLVPAAVAARPAGEGGPGYTVEQTHHWLRGLALHLAEQRTQGKDAGTIALHELWRIAGPKRRRLAKFLTVPALLTMAAFITVRPVVDFAGGLVLGLACGMWAGTTTAMLLPGPRRLIMHVSSRRTLWHRIWLGICASLSGLLWGGLLTGIVVRVMLGSPSGVRAGVVAGAAAMFSYGPTVFLAGDRRTQPDEFRAIRDDWTTGLIIGLVSGVLAGVFAWLAFRLTAGIAKGLAPGFQLGPQSALGIAIGVGIGTALSLAWTSVRYWRACRLLRRSGFFDGHPAPFLDWARTAGLLRAAGGAYEFRYEAHQQWLADHPRPADREAR